MQHSQWKTPALATEPKSYSPKLGSLSLPAQQLNAANTATEATTASDGDNGMMLTGGGGGDRPTNYLTRLVRLLLALETMA